MFFNRFAFLQVIHCHYQSQASSMPSKEEWFTYDTTVFLHLNNHIQNQRKEMQERKQGNDGHLQHVMASLVIIYNLCFDFFFFFDVSYWFVFILGEGRDVETRGEQKAPVSITAGSTFVVFTPDCVRNNLQKPSFLYPVCNHSSPKASTVRCTAKWSQVVVKWDNRTLCPAAVQ